MKQLVINRVNKNLRFRHLKRELKHSRQQFGQKFNTTKLSNMTIIAMMMIVTAAGVFLSHGYHGGFFTLNGISQHLPESLLQMTTFLGDASVSLALVLYFARKNPAAIWVVFVAALIGILLTHGMKDYFSMLRPASVLSSSDLFITGHPVYLGSFPSGHSLTIFVFIATLFYFSSKVSTQISLMLFASFVALSRVLVGAHWPIDVFIGSALGIISTVIAIHVCRRIKGGFHIVTHCLLVGLFLVAGLTLFEHNGGYPLAADLGKLIGTFSIIVFVKDYCLPKFKSKRVVSSI